MSRSKSGPSNSNGSTPELIDALVADFKPVPHSSSIWPGAWLTSFVFLLSSFAVLLISWPLREDMDELLHHSSSIITLILLSGVLILATFAIAQERIPGRTNRTSRISMFFAISLYFVSLVSLTEVSPAEFFEVLARTSNAGSACSWRVMLLGLPILIIGSAWLKSGAPTQLYRSGFLLGVSATVTGALVISFSCESSHARHLLLSHSLIPIFIVSILSTFLFGRFLRW